MSCLDCRSASHAVQPTDARLMVFESVSEATTLWIKGEHFNLRNLCNNMWKAEQLDGCSLVISRYSPQVASHPLGSTQRPFELEGSQAFHAPASALQVCRHSAVSKGGLVKTLLKDATTHTVSARMAALQACATGLSQVSCTL